jgi:hypothetical protein
MSDNVENLKNLISSTLEQRGVLAKIRAELRHHVFLALDEQESASDDKQASEQHAASPRTRSHVSVKKKKLDELHGSPAAEDVLELIKDFLEFFELEYTNALLNTEAEAVSASRQRTGTHGGE